MVRKRSFVAGRIVRRVTTIILLRGTAGPIAGPWQLSAVLLTG
jgi:hypothetical protein